MQMPSEDEINNCLTYHLPYEIDMLRVAAGRLKEVKERGTDTNILIEVFCVHARNLIEFFDARREQPGDFKAYQFANGYTCGVDLEDQRRRINKRIAHLTTERVRGDDNDKISVDECLGTYSKLENEIDRFMACLPPQVRSALSARLNVPRQQVALMVADPESTLRGALTTASPSYTTMTVVWPPRRSDEPHG